jgi:surface carbohydrate biosynthesis protein
MNKTRIAIYVDSRYRDTFASVLLKRELSKRLDADVLVVSIDLWEQVSSLFNPHVVVLNHVIGYRNRRIAGMSDVTIVLPTEGRPNTQEQLEWYTSNQDGYADLFLSWNEPVAAAFKRTEAVVVGAPRFDIYHSHLHLIDSKGKARAKYGLEQNMPVVGVFTSFPQARYAHSAVAFNEHDWCDLGVTQISTRTNPTEFAQSELRARNEFLTKVAAFSYDNPEFQFLIKPHPMEDVLQTLQFADEHGMAVITQDTIQNVLSAVDVVVNRKACLTTADAWLMGKGVVSIGEYESQDGLALTDYPATDLNMIHDVIADPNKYIDHDYLNRIGVGRASAAYAAQAIYQKIRNKQFGNREYSVAGRIALGKIMAEHSRRFGMPIVEHGAVGKNAIHAYIKGVEQKL